MLSIETEFPDKESFPVNEMVFAEINADVMNKNNTTWIVNIFFIP
jgi:hypothetical protein